MNFKTLSLILCVGLISGLNCARKGCTDPTSLAYNEEASKDDGSCTYPATLKKALVFKKTATWCGYCGTWGTDFSTDLDAAYSNCQIIQLHWR